MNNRIAHVLVVAVFFTSLFTPFSTAHAASLVVNSLADNTTKDGLCTLREAFQNANSNSGVNSDCSAGSGADTITFSVSGTIPVSSSLGQINDPAGLTIDGTGQAVTLQGTGGMVAAMIQPLTVNHLTFSNYAPAFNALNNLTITNSVFINNTGGAIYTQNATLTVDNTTFSGNSISGDGGAIYALAGAMNISNSTFTGNSAHQGGAIFSYNCNLHLTNTTVSENHTPNGTGGGIYSIYGPLAITGSTISSNGASYGNGGGGVYASGSGITVTGSTFSDNSAPGSVGGAIYGGSTMDIRTSTFRNNSATSGGAIYYIVGGNYTSTIVNSTFTGNSATDTPGTGGAIYNPGTLILTNDTFSGNSASVSGGSLYNTLVLKLRNTIVTNSTGGNCAGTITNDYDNIDNGTTCGWGTAHGSMSSTNPLLGALTGSPAYFPLNVGSPAIDKGDDTTCAASPVNNQSQNGMTRPQGAHCDIGSYERSGDNIPPVVQSILRADANPTDSTSVNFTVTFSEAVTGVDPSDFDLTVNGVTGALITTVSGGATAYAVTVNTGSGIGTIRLDLLDNDSIVDSSQIPLGGPGAGNGNFSNGESYQVRYLKSFLPLVHR